MSSPAQFHPRTISPKLLRQLHTLLITLHTSLIEEQVLLERIWYKSHAQFRGQKWFQSIDAVRKCLRTLLGERKGYIRSRKGKAKAVEPEGGMLVQLLKSVIATYCSLSQEPIEIPQDPLDKLPKLVSSNNTPSSSRSTPQLSTENLHLLHTLLMLLSTLHLLTALQLRCRSAFDALVTHLRTPPAPTFAPVTLVLCSVVANIDSLCSQSHEQSEQADQESKAKNSNLITTYHTLADVLLSAPQSDASHSTVSVDKKRKRTSSSSSTPLHMTRHTKKLQALLQRAQSLNLTDLSIEDKHRLPLRISPHPDLLSNKRIRTSTTKSVPGMNQLQKQRRTLLEEYDQVQSHTKKSQSQKDKVGNKMVTSNTAAAASSRSALLASLGIGGDADEDTGYAVDL